MKEHLKALVLFTIIFLVLLAAAVLTDRFIDQAITP